MWMAVIFALSSVPGGRIPSGYGVVAHFVVYAILGGLLVVPLGRSRASGESVALAVLFASIYGVTDEIHQAFVPMRTPDVADWGVDTLGAFAGALAMMWLVSLLLRWRNERTKAQ